MEKYSHAIILGVMKETKMQGNKNLVMKIKKKKLKAINLFALIIKEHKLETK